MITFIKLNWLNKSIKSKEVNMAQSYFLLHLGYSLTTPKPKYLKPNYFFTTYLYSPNHCNGEGTKIPKVGR